MVFENGVKNIQAAAYNGARTVVRLCLKTFRKYTCSILKKEKFGQSIVPWTMVNDKCSLFDNKIG